MQKVARLLSSSAMIGVSLVASACQEDATPFTAPISQDALLATSGGSGATQNGQSIMMTPLFAGSYTVTGEETWKMDDDAARLLYTTIVSGPTVSCSGSSTNCDPSNQPPTPSAPPNDPNQPTNSYFQATADKNRCVFWNGGDPDTPAPYTKSVTGVNGLNGRGNWSFEWTYTLIAPTGVAAKTAWYLQSSTGSGDAQVDLDGFVAGQSNVKKIKAAKNEWTFKTSHTINDGLGGHRVVNLAYNIDGAGATLFDPSALQLETGVDFYYAQNSGNNGFTNLLVDGGMVNNIQNGLLAAYSGEKDDFSGNNATLGERVNFYGPTASLGGGNHTVQITGIVKGNNGLGDLNINVTSQLIIHAQSCSVNP